MEELSSNKRRYEFYKKFRAEIVPILRKYENERKSKRKLAITIILSMFIFFSFFLINFDYYLVKFVLNIDALPVLIVPGVISSIVWSILEKNFECKIKNEIMPIILSCLGDLEWKQGYYYHNGKFFYEAHVIPHYSNENYDDIFEGSYKGVKIEIVESDFTVGSGKDKNTVFSGVIVKIDMNKEFKSHTVIAPDTLFHVSPKWSLKRTTLEDVGFEKKYDVFTNNEVEARYLITPSFMERLKNMKLAFSAGSVNCAFYKKYFIVALRTYKDLFNLCSLSKPIDDPKLYFKLYEEVNSIVELIDLFKLNQKTGL